MGAKKRVKTAEICPGDRIEDSIGIIRVMAIVEERWVVARRLGCIPFVQSVEDFRERFIPSHPLTAREVKR